MSISTEIQKAVYTKLNADLSTPVYDYVPQDSDSGSSTPFPYVTIGEDVVTEFDTDTDSGGNVLITIHTWSRAKGRKECKDIQGAIYTSLHRQTLAISGYNFIDCFFVSEQSFFDTDGYTRHGVSSYRILIDEP